MGVVWASLATLGVLLTGALLTWWLEPRLLKTFGSTEPGPAATLDLRKNPRPSQADPLT